MKTFAVKAAHPDHKRIRIVCWAWSRNYTRFDIRIEGESILDRGGIRTYAAVHNLSATNWVAKKTNEALEILLPGAFPLDANELEATLLKAVLVCEARYGRNSNELGDAEVIFN